ncbi:MarR family winged helix-turn-helix transcriptional regulator [Clostridium botulinum]|uniref:MarR family winged helix-turn-helix transcriptional regulator n=2 Tax=Clostridium botulinum TaxID=1491 RepID=UPI00020750D8|nr:MarR family transcriptional regulator [Clostridium botulinum]AEB74727.1 transcriptional regulator, MarR family [Clostridium botulinum BKT015925]MCD3197879.1 MarR family transcriptional regulator [Clostridium botulinum C/D]MCD3204166.1 MarR family transcriptional regulator [Clostridium botulinum C/D]MCD3210705.1 MarR family transcriptional regulator [Clostridium botulinum C/D]MCD3214536.1 MarR family transcriptional regulator [Clostridium botulinum C/D]
MVDKDIKTILNELLVDTFNEILTIEQTALKSGKLNDLSVTEVHTIETIGMYKSRTMSEIAGDLGITVGTLTTAINNLVKKEYVERKRDENDRRVVKVVLTKKGKLAYRVHEKFHSDMVNATIDGLTETQEKVLADALSKLNDFFKNNYIIKNQNKKE